MMKYKTMGRFFHDCSRTVCRLLAQDTQTYTVCNKPSKDEAQTALFKDPVRTAL